MPQNQDLPLADSAVFFEHQTTCLGIVIDGEVIAIFPRSHPYVKVKRIADRLAGTIQECDTTVTYTVLPTNRPYVTTPILERR